MSAFSSGQAQWLVPASGSARNYTLVVALTDLRRKVSLFGVLAFIVLSIADLLLTRLLLLKSNFMIYEANPVANYILETHGWTGLTVFKLTAVSLIAMIILYVGYFRPVTAKRLLRFACVLMATVVVYSLYLVSQFV